MATRNLFVKFSAMRSNAKAEGEAHSSLGEAHSSPEKVTPKPIWNSASSPALAPSKSRVDGQLNDAILQVHQCFDLLIEDIDQSTLKLKKIYDNVFYTFKPELVKEEKQLVSNITKQLSASQKCLHNLKQFLSPKTQQEISPSERTIITNLHQGLYAKYSQRVKKMNELIRMKDKMHAEDLSQNDLDDALLSKSQTTQEDSRTSEREDFQKFESLTLEQRDEWEADQRRVEHRNAQIKELARDVTMLHQMFQEVNEMVYNQGTVLDNITYNIENAKLKTEEGTKEIVSAEQHQKSASSLRNKLIIGLTGIVVSLGITLGIKKI